MTWPLRSASMCRTCWAREPDKNRPATAAKVWPPDRGNRRFCQVWRPYAILEKACIRG